jgi:hypothetical protein
MATLNESAREKCLRALGFSKSGDLDHAISWYRAALSDDPDQGLIHYQLGVVLQLHGQLAEAEHAYRGAIARDYLEAHLQLGKLLVATGRWVEGWKEMQWWDLAVHGQKPFRKPEWDGKFSAGMTLLLCPSWNGFGDTIHFIRFLPMLRNKGIKPIVACQEPLIPLLAHCYPTEEFVSIKKRLQRFDAYLRLESLPWALGITLENLPNFVPYVTVPEERRVKWAGKVSSEANKKVCVIWEGKTIRDVPADLRGALSGIPGIQVFELKDFPVSDFADTAAVLEQMDLVVTVDTAAAHLAGAMNKPVWVLVPHDGDWRWMLDRTDTPWYPSMRLFRQKKPGEWKTPIEEVLQTLKMPEWRTN